MFLNDKVDESHTTTLSVFLKGGLGNQLFQIASCLGISREQHLQFNVINCIHNDHSTMNYFDTIFRKIKLKDTAETNPVFDEPGNMFARKINMPTFCCDTVFNGFFQNEKYFSKYRNEIIDLFGMEEDRRLYLYNKYTSLYNGFFIHYRRGDYANNPHYDILTDYYDKCFEHIQNTTFVFYIVSDDIKYCKQNRSLQQFLINKEHYYIENEDEVNSLYLMSLCEKGGIGANSTFSWWGGYLNTHSEKRVFYPKQWYYQNDIIDIWWDGSIVL